jgi:hypothetical protein
MHAEPNSTSSTYQPTLDLRDYQYPSISHSEGEQLAGVVEKLKTNGSSMVLPVICSAEPDNIVIKDLWELNNVLVVGPPAMGKSTFLHQVVMSLLFTKHPAEIKL